MIFRTLFKAAVWAVFAVVMLGVYYFAHWIVGNFGAAAALPFIAAILLYAWRVDRKDAAELARGNSGISASDAEAGGKRIDALDRR